MSKKGSRPICVNADGTELYVKVAYSGIHMLCLLSDGIPFTFFGNEKTAYLKMQQVIDWHEKELRESGGRSGSAKTLEAAKELLAKFRRGEMRDDDGIAANSGTNES